jgi:hypothetical protein
MGISSAANVIMAIKMARYYELTEKDVIMTVFTDSMELYDSRMKEMEEAFGPYTDTAAAVDFNQHIAGLSVDWMKELNYYDRKTVHNLKYYTWIEQQGRELDELNAQWYDYEEYWDKIPTIATEIDKKINDFNQMTGLL